MYRIGLFVFIAMLGTAGFAQDLDTVTISDQFNSGGSRGQQQGGANFGAAATDGSQFVDYSGTDFTASITTSARYINSWGTDPGVLESPIVTVTSAMDNLDRNLGGTIPGVAANTRPGATGGSTAVQIGDDGGFNALFFGESNDSDYFVEVDVYCPNTAAGYEAAGLAVRAGRDNNAPYYGEFTYNPDRTSSYCMYYDYSQKTVNAVRWKLSNTQTEITSRATSASVSFGTVPTVTQGWHTMRIDCRDNFVVFKFDGATVATVNDAVTSINPTDPTQTKFDFGRPCLYYREASVASADEKQGLFDNLRAGPSPANTGVSDWSVY